jgi:hypothetical protein
MATAAIPTAAERRAAMLAAVAVKNDAASEQKMAETRLAQQVHTESHFWRVITTWCTSTDVRNASTLKESVTVPIGQVRSETLIAWEAMLAAKGFVTARDGNRFVVSLPPAATPAAAPAAVAPAGAAALDVQAK